MKKSQKIRLAGNGMTASAYACEPLLPAALRPELADLTCAILREAGRLSAEIPAAATRAPLAGLLREMNSYYSNLIEGHRTLPRDIERALRRDFSSEPKARDNQWLHVAHIHTQEELESRLRAGPVNLHDPEFLRWLHGEFYHHLPAELRCGYTVSGQRYELTPGAWRDFPVTVGRHHPPPPAALPALMQRLNEGYNRPDLRAADQLLVCAASHHRILWIHPFGDGNGRVGRLHSQACLRQAQVDGLGLWTISRGLARHRSKYYEMLQRADQPRTGDLDGRGNLTDQGLGEFCRFFLETMLDQIRFMTHLLDPPLLLARIKLHLERDAPALRKHPAEAFRLLKALFLEGELPRGRVPEIIGRKESTAAKLVKLLLAEELVASPSPKGRLTLAFPARVLESYFPRLFLDLPYGD